jgi:hypothetical protein
MKKLNQAGLGHLLMIIIAVVVVGAVGFAGWRVMSSNTTEKSTNSDASDQEVTEETAQIKLDIVSEPAGIVMSADSACQDQLKEKQTPTSCETDSEFTTIVTAPAIATVDGRKLSFQTWDGCSEGNADKKICKVIVGESRIIKAIYSTAPANPDTGSASQTSSNPTSKPSNGICGSGPRIVSGRAICEFDVAVTSKDSEVRLFVPDAGQPGINDVSNDIIYSCSASQACFTFNPSSNDYDQAFTTLNLDRSVQFLVKKNTKVTISYPVKRSSIISQVGGSATQEYTFQDWVYTLNHGSTDGPTNLVADLQVKYGCSQTGPGSYAGACK